MNKEQTGSSPWALEMQSSVSWTPFAGLLTTQADSFWARAGEQSKRVAGMGRPQKETENFAGVSSLSFGKS